MYVVRLIIDNDLIVSVVEILHLAFSDSLYAEILRPLNLCAPFIASRSQANEVTLRLKNSLAHIKSSAQDDDICSLANFNFY